MEIKKTKLKIKYMKMLDLIFKNEEFHYKPIKAKGAFDDH